MDGEIWSDYSEIFCGVKRHPNIYNAKTDQKVNGPIETNNFRTEGAPLQKNLVENILWNDFSEVYCLLVK